MPSYTSMGGGARAISMRELRDMPFDDLARSVERVGGGAAVAGLGARVGGTGAMLPPLPSALAALRPHARGTSPPAALGADDLGFTEMARLLLHDAPLPRGRTSPSHAHARGPLNHRRLAGAPGLGGLGDTAPPRGRRSLGPFGPSESGSAYDYGAPLGVAGDPLMLVCSSAAASRASSRSGLEAGAGAGTGGLPFPLPPPLSYEQLLLLDEGRVRRGVRHEVVRGLPRRTATRSDSSSQCHICLDRFSPGATRIATLPCAHAFCDACIRPWLAANTTCPVCRWAFPQHHTQLLPEPPA